MRQDLDSQYLRVLQTKASGHKKLSKFKVTAWNWDSRRLYFTVLTGHNNVYSCKVPRSKLTHNLDVDLNTVYKALRKVLDHGQRDRKTSRDQNKGVAGQA